MGASCHGADGADEIRGGRVLQNESLHSCFHEFDHVLVDRQEIDRDDAQLGRFLSELADEV